MPDASPDQLIRRDVLQSRPYQVADATGRIKLDAMENPHELPEALRDEWRRALTQVRVNRYPDAAATEVKEKLHRAFDIPSGFGILLGNGSDEVIQIICTALSGPGRCLLAAEPSFVMYRTCATLFGLRYEGVALTPDFALDEKAMLAAVERYQPGVILLAHPNNPSGNLLDADAIRRIIGCAPGLVVIDEAYHSFARSSFLPLLERFPNVLVMRTLSKLGLAGLRLGFAVGARQWIEEFDKVRLPYNIGSLTQCSVSLFLDHLDVFTEQAGRILSQRDALLSALQELPEIQVWPNNKWVQDNNKIKKYSRFIYANRGLKYT